MTDQQSVDELRALIDERVESIARRDPHDLARRQHPEVLAFNVLPPLRLVGADAVPPQTEAWLAGYADGPGYQVRDVQIDAERELARATSEPDAAGGAR